MSKKNVQDIMMNVSQNCCLILCYLYWVNPFLLDTTYAKQVIDSFIKGFIDKDGYVLDAEKLLSYFDEKGRFFRVSKKKITSLDELPEEGCYPTFYSIDGYNGHWVLANREGIVWNSLANSRNVNRGKPRQFRFIEVV